MRSSRTRCLRRTPGMRLGRSTGSTISSRGLGGAEACTSSRRREDRRRAPRLAGLGRRRRRCRRRGATTRGRVPGKDCPPPVGDGRRRRRRHRRRRLMRGGVSALTRTTVDSGPAVCRDCVWWQSRGNRTASKERWAERAEEDFGEWGTIYLDDDGRLLGSMQSALAPLSPRGRLPRAGVGDDAVLVTAPTSMRDGLGGREVAPAGRDRWSPQPRREGNRAFAYRYPEGESV